MGTDLKRVVACRYTDEEIPTHTKVGATACDVADEADMMSDMELGLNGRVCVVTGASSGIGLAVACMLCKEGASVMMLARDPERLEQAATRARRQGRGRVAVLALDVVASDATERVRTECGHVLGPVDVLVNNAGTSFSRPLLQLSDTDWQSQWELHVMAPMRFMRARVPDMAERGWAESSTSVPPPASVPRSPTSPTR
jgi:NADP-dependent 3-hydroxy acid dehydrogenase YdfG